MFDKEMTRQETNTREAGRSNGLNCLVCESTSLLELLQISDVPIHCNTLWPTREAARHAPKGNINLAFCTQCGHTFNRAFSPPAMKYGEEYENSLYFSPRFRQYSEQLVGRLTSEFRLYDKAIVEIGSGHGDFLRALCRDGRNRGIGFDPSYVAPDSTPEYLTFRTDLYSTEYSDAEADFVCSRHVLEHVADPLDILGAIRTALRGMTRSYGYCEVPNADFLFDGGSVWDIIYAHASYFSRTSLVNLFERAGFEALRAEPCYGGQFLGIDFRTTNNHPRKMLPVVPPPGLLPSVARLPRLYKDAVAYWAERMYGWAAEGRNAVIWGGGAKCVSFLQAIANVCPTPYVVDVNPRKHYQFVPGSGAEIVPPEFLKQRPPDVVVVMNPIYQDEIQLMLEDLELRSVETESITCDGRGAGLAKTQ
jgi:SAM-dependent methyltransferase